METPAQKYIHEHSTPQSEALAWVERQTNIRTNYPRMLSGAMQGQLMKMLVQLMGARRVLEIGTFTGYSAICMAQGLPQDGHIDTLEHNDELVDLILEGFSMSGLQDKISLHVGDALESLKTLSDNVYDLVYIDADKREYASYYEAVLPLLRQGGCILADDVLLGGKLFGEKVSVDKQTQGLLHFNDLVASDPRVEVVILPIRDGLSIIRKK